MRQGAGTFVADVTVETRSRERAAASRRLVRQMLAEAARLGIAPADLRAALDRELPEES
jgi:DNA-binding transcriptional regulator YhcF (GntR family)